MAQTGFTPLQIYSSSTTTNVPTAGNLTNSTQGAELAINIADGKLFYKDSGGVVQVLATKGGVGSSTTTQVLYNSSGLIVGSANLTFNGTTLTTANDASISGLTVGKGGGAVIYNTVVGISGLANNSSGNYNSAFGANWSGVLNGPLYSNTTGTWNSAYSLGSLGANTTGSYNTAYGASSLAQNTTASNNTAVGYQSAYTNATGSGITAVGYQALYSNTGNGNTAVGGQVLYSNTSGGANNGFGSSDSAVGSALQYNTTGGFNNAFGNGALATNTTGGANSAFGHQALNKNTTASNNTAVGYQAGYANTTGAGNVFVGNNTGTSSNANNNTFVGGNSAGFGAGLGVTSGTNNSFFGSAAGANVTTGSKNTIIGSYNGNQGGLDIRTANNYIVLSDGDGNPRAYSDVNGSWNFIATASAEVGTFRNFGTSSNYGVAIVSYATVANTGALIRAFAGTTPAVVFNVAGNGNATNTNNSYGAISDIKLKENIVDATPKLDDLMKVKIRQYNLISDESKTKQIGVVAQELEEVFAGLVEKTTDRDAEGNDLGTTTKAVKYSVFVPMLIKAIQELKLISDEQTVKLEAQADLITTMQAKLKDAGVLGF